jgi:hypothetical protein
MSKICFIFRLALERHSHSCSLVLSMWWANLSERDAMGQPFWWCCQLASWPSRLRTFPVTFVSFYIDFYPWEQVLHRQGHGPSVDLLLRRSTERTPGIGPSLGCGRLCGHSRSPFGLSPRGEHQFASLHLFGVGWGRSNVGYGLRATDSPNRLANSCMATYFYWKFENLEAKT